MNQENVDHELTFFQTSSGPQEVSSGIQNPSGNIRVSLEDGELWSRFQCLTNEMILTKIGRRMFPVIKVRISGLEPTSFYSILLEFKQIEKTRWRYIGGKWLPGNLLSLPGSFLDKF